MHSSLLKVLSIPLISLVLSACGAGASTTLTITADRIAEYDGNWQSSCSYDSSTGLSSIDTLYITDSEYTQFTDVFDNNNCFGSSDYTTEIEGYLYYGAYLPYASSYCANTIEVDFTAAVIYEDGVKIPSSQINDFLDLPTKTTQNLMCTRNGELYTGDLSLDDGSRDSTRPLALDYDRPLIAF